MKKLIILFLLLAVVIPSAQASDKPPVEFPQEISPAIGQSEAPEAFKVDLTNLPVPEELASTGFAMELNTQKRDLSIEWVESLNDEQRANIGQLLADNHSPVLDSAMTELGQAQEGGVPPDGDVQALETLLAEVDRWQTAMSAGLTEILTPEQYALYQESLLPAPDLSMPAAPEARNDCWYAYAELYYGETYAYYFYLYAYYTNATSSDPYAYLTYDLAYKTYLYAYYAKFYTYYAYYYYTSIYRYYAYYFTRHAEGFAYYGYKMAYILYTFTTSNSYSYNSYYYGWYAHYRISRADSYAVKCYTGTLSGGQSRIVPQLVAPESRFSSLPDDLRAVGDSGGVMPPLGMTVDVSSPPVPEEAETGFAMPLDLRKAQAGAEWVGSLTADQRERVQALLEANQSASLEQAAAALAPAAESADASDLDRETMDAAMAEVKQWQKAISGGLAEILTPEQYATYQDSLLPDPTTWQVEAPETQNDCYYAYYYGRYNAYYYAYYYYLYAYYTNAYYSDPYLYSSYLFAYNSYVMSYYGWYYSWYAYAGYYNSTYAYYAWYYLRHAEGFSYYGYPFAYMARSWVGGSYAYNAYYYGYYTYYWTNIADAYAVKCRTTRRILNVPNVKQTQSQWCWAATTEGILKYDGTTVAQCTIANWNWSRTDCCRNPSSSNCNQPTGMFGGTTPPGLQTCLHHWGVSSTPQSSRLTFAVVVSEINAGRPAVARWGWTSGGGHFLTVRGYDSLASNVYYINPGDGGYHTSTYSWFRQGGSHTWTHSLRNVH